MYLKVQRNSEIIGCQRRLENGDESSEENAVPLTFGATKLALFQGEERFARTLDSLT